ncbi:hypothetical protein ABGB12_03200 [Actinocorallia sp. B10E7]|uniref:hypothetical protein n=1 Tax=Actinocorallia sp. B10E7 TaxID=3153558 RepID=UPI00325E42EB
MSKAEAPIKERITVNLTPKAAQALEALTKSTGDTKTDAINRALQVYDFLDKIIRDGGRVYVQEPGSDVQERVRFL